MRVVSVSPSGADNQCMSLEGTHAPVTVGEDFGLAGHLASIARLHREALAQLDALVQPWGNLWSPRLGAAASQSVGQPVSDRQAARGAHAAAA
jgi:hypothetical protein